MPGVGGRDLTSLVDRERPSTLIVSPSAIVSIYQGQNTDSEAERFKNREVRLCL